jgi:hypothetical protein
MPTKDPQKNLEYVKKSQARKKEALGLTEYNRITADTEQKHRDKLKATMGIDEYRKEQAEYMKKYRAKQRALKVEIEKKQKAYTTLTDAMRAKKARIQVNKLRDEKERQEKVKNDVSSILNSIIDAVPVVSKNKKNREAVARHKAKKAQGETITYNTRSKGRTLNL